MNFTYTDNTDRYSGILEQKICDLQCKHVMVLNSEKAKMVWEESKHIDAMKNMWGYTSGIWKDEKENKLIQMHTIKKMVYKCLYMPFRIVIDTKGFIWTDNLHSSIRDIMVYGTGTKLKDVSCYIIDLRSNIPVVVNVRHSLHNDINDIKGAVHAAYQRNGRISDTIRNINYTVKEFLYDNGINRETIGLNDEMIQAYKDGRADKICTAMLKKEEDRWEKKHETEILRQNLINKIRDTKCCSMLQAINFADTIIYGLPAVLYKNIEEWINGKEISDIQYLGTSIPQIMKPYINDIHEGFVDSAMCMVMYLDSQKRKG